MKSPVDGIVGTLAVAERASVAQNAPLLTVVDLTAFEIEFQVPESYADDLGLGMDAEVTYAARKYAAKVSAVSPEVRQGQVTGRLRFSGETPQGLRQNQRAVDAHRARVARQRAEGAARRVPRHRRRARRLRRAGRHRRAPADPAPAPPAWPKSRSSKASSPAIASSFQTWRVRARRNRAAGRLTQRFPRDSPCSPCTTSARSIARI